MSGVYTTLSFLTTHKQDHNHNSLIPTHTFLTFVGDMIKLQTGSRKRGGCDACCSGGGGGHPPTDRHTTPTYTLVYPHTHLHVRGLYNTGNGTRSPHLSSLNPKSSPVMANAFISITFLTHSHGECCYFYYISYQHITQFTFTISQTKAHHG